MGGPTAQKFIWGSLRLWWAVKILGVTAHKIWRFGAESGIFLTLCSKNIKKLIKIDNILEKILTHIFLKKVHLP